MTDVIALARAVLGTTPARWNALAALPASLLDQPPRAGEWSATACLGHLVDTERYVFPLRVRAFLAGQDFPAFDPDAQGTRIAAGQAPALAAEFAELRATNLALLDSVTAADLVRTARHQELGPVTLDELLHEWAAHDLNHTIQAEQSVMQPFIAGCGPWRGYFVAHDQHAAG